MGAEVGLGEGDGEGGVGGEIEGGGAFAPVSVGRVRLKVCGEGGVGGGILYDCDVDGGCCAGAVDLVGGCVCHR